MSRPRAIRSRLTRTTIVAATMAVFALAAWLATVYAQSPAEGPSGWHSSTRSAAEPERLPPQVVDGDLPQLPPRKVEENASLVTPQQLLSSEPLLESMLYEHANVRNPAQHRLPEVSPATPSHAAPEPTGLLGEMLQMQPQNSPRVSLRSNSPAPSRLPRANVQMPNSNIASAHFQDDFDLAPPQIDDPVPIPEPRAPLIPEGEPEGESNDGLEDQPDPAAENVDPPAGEANSREPTLGEAPEEDHAYLQFLRQETILLEPGEHQLDISIQYLLDTTDFSFAAVDEENNVEVINLRRRQRLILLPVELRYGLTCTTQAFINVPMGWSSDEVIFGNEEDTSDAAGIGDISLGLTEVLFEGDGQCADVLATIAVTAPTGDSSFSSSLAVPGSALGSGFWAVSAGLTFIQTYDPIVVYYGIGYQHRFDNTFAGGFDVNPGEIISYRLGVGFAVNPQVTLSAAFNGAYITENEINGILVHGSDQEPLSLRFAATIAKDTCAGCGSSVKTVEPFANIGMTNDAINSLIGISWTH